MRSSSNSGLKQGQNNSTKNKDKGRDRGGGPGTLKIVGLGPGSMEYIAPKAMEALQHADVVVGYRTYIDLLPSFVLEGKEVISTGMKGELDRCRKAIHRTMNGSNTVVISSGDPGIYGMSGLVLELLSQEGILDAIDLEVIPGIPALSAAGALLGAPLMHDFAVISLSDLMTPWEAIQSRVEAALKTDFVLVLYNPRSKRRDWQLDTILKLIIFYRGDRVPVGVVRNATRPGEEVEIVSASTLDPSCVDMLSIILVGNSSTRIIGGKMVTPRGYLKNMGANNVGGNT